MPRTVWAAAPYPSISSRGRCIATRADRNVWSGRARPVVMGGESTGGPPLGPGVCGGDRQCSQVPGIYSRDRHSLACVRRNFIHTTEQAWRIKPMSDGNPHQRVEAGMPLEVQLLHPPPSTVPLGAPRARTTRAPRDATRRCMSRSNSTGETSTSTPLVSCHVASCHAAPTRITLRRRGSLVSGLAGVRPRDLAADFAYRPRPQPDRHNDRHLQPRHARPRQQAADKCRWHRSRPATTGHARSRCPRPRAGSARRLRRRTDAGRHGVAAS
jgi:hypothetical protein